MSGNTKEEFTFEPVNSDGCIYSLRELSKLLQSCVGANGRPKILVTAGNYDQMTACSKTIADRLDAQNPICRYILQGVKSRLDFGLYQGILVSSVLQQLWTMQSKHQVETSCVTESLEYLLNRCMTLLSCTEAKLNVDFSSVKELMIVVNNIISSKPFLLLSETFTEDLTIAVVKSFLLSITNDFTINKIIIQCEQGSEESNCYNGILYQIFEEERIVFDKIKTLNVGVKFQVLLFTIKLSEENEESYSLETIFKILRSAVKFGIHIVACQKVVHDSIKLFLSRNNVLLLERLGTEKIKALTEMSLALPVSDINKVSEQDIVKVRGFLTSVDLVQFNKKDYLLLENNERNIVSLVVCSSCLAEEHEVKIVVEQTIATLQSIATHPWLIPGAGCFEVWLILQLQLTQDPERQRTKADEILFDAFQIALILASGLQPSVSYDTVFHHAWSGDESDWCKCNCGLITKMMVTTENGKWVLMDKHGIINVSNQSFSVNSVLLEKEVVYDCFILKQNALKSAVEMCINLFSIGLIVYRQ